MAKLHLQVLHGHAREEIQHEREILQVVAGDLSNGVENGGATKTIAFDEQVAACDGDAAAFAVENSDFRLLDVCLISCSKPWCGDGYACKTRPWIGDFQSQFFCETLSVADGACLRIGETACA